MFLFSVLFLRWSPLKTTQSAFIPILLVPICVLITKFVYGSILRPSEYPGLNNPITVGRRSLSSLGASYTPMIDDLSLSSKQTDETVFANWWQNFTIEKYTNALLNTTKEIELTDKDLSYIERKKT